MSFSYVAQMRSSCCSERCRALLVICTVCLGGVDILLISDYNCLLGRLSFYNSPRLENNKNPQIFTQCRNTTTVSYRRVAECRADMIVQQRVW